MFDFSWYFKKYGIEPLSFEEEINLPMARKKTRNNKIKMVDMCESIIKYATWLEEKAIRIPEEDDERHSEMVDRLTEKTRTVVAALDLAYFYNGEDVK